MSSDMIMTMLGRPARDSAAGWLPQLQGSREAPAEAERARRKLRREGQLMAVIAGSIFA
jgi:hypothetical protein